MPSRNTGCLLLLLGLGLAACNKDGGRDTDGGDTDGGDDLPGVLFIDCSTAEFGAVEFGSSQSVTLEARNNGTGPLVIDGVSVGEPFVAVATTPIQVSSSYKFSVQFQPTTFGDFSSELSVSWSTAGAAQTPFTCAITGSITGDADGDGYISVDAGGDDCDDTDPDVHVDAVEAWYDGVDQDCDGASDFDQDGDGYESEVFNEEPPYGGDCQDVLADIFPGADEIIYDGVDQDCDGSNDYDQDGDGFTSQAYGGTDCDDYDTDIRPEAVEAFDGIDNDCDGVKDEGATADESSVLILGASATDAAGNSIAVGDFDDNGTTDLLMGVWYYKYAPAATGTAGDSTGAVAVFMNESWTDGDTIDDGDNFIAGAGSSDEFGYAIADVGDFDADGSTNVAISATAYNSKAGRVYLFSGSDLGAATVTTATHSYTGEDDNRLGMGLMTDTDMNADGVSDLVMYGVDSWDVYNYLAIAYGGGATGDSDWDDIDATWVLKCGTEATSTTPAYCGPSSSRSQGGTETWANGAGAGQDINGDGYHDLLLGDPYNDDNATNSGKVWILWGRSAQFTANEASFDATATVVAQGSSASALVGKTVGVTPDADGDGDAEIWIEDGKTEDLYFFTGGTDLSAGVLSLAADASATFAFSGDVVTSMPNVGDWSGDGVDDFGIAFGGEGEVLFFESKLWSGSVTPSTALMGSLIGGENNKDFGSAMAPRATDMNGDGKPDLAIGDYTYDSGLGSLHLFYKP